MPIWVHPEEAEESVEFLEKVECWGELEKRIRRQGGEGEFLGLEILMHYGAIYGAVKMPQKRKCKIPGTLVGKNGIDYCIHGLVHIPERIPYVREKFSGIKEVACETNMKKLFGLSNLVDQDRIDECKYLPVLDAAIAFGRIYGESVFFQVLSKFQSREAVEYMKAQWDVMVNENERLLMIIGDVPVFVSDIRLPERLEHGYIKASIDGTYYNKFATLRSLSHSEFLEKFAKSRGLKEAHGIYGIAHEPEIAYFLRYPEKAEEIKDRFRWKGSISILPFFW